ncbi:MAG: tRNA uridine-5-carboxymethylaminomethyl(34) synthesis GTPase MnmE [Deltaproteobacteria bacterium]|nr:tRNA uridine-5-carboxymethylaminomethyl(34) synthesis GTPase MnmE [Deltaproteobacteria bacterium]
MDTIAAIATPHGLGGIGIIKISGPEAIPVASRIFRNGPPPVTSCNQSDDGETQPFFFRPWRLHYGHIVDTRKDGHVYDEVLLAVMPSPRSYTREDVVEIQAHAGPVILKRILNLIIGHEGVRLSDPGEFTRRAFLNGRIDLTEAEGVMDMISAKSVAAAGIAMAHISGLFRDSIKKLISMLYDLRVPIEAGIDFPDDMDGETDCHEVAIKLTEAVLNPLKQLVEHHHAGNFFRTGLSVVIAGGPNVGKSSLMNRLLHEERAIVSDIPGTTRDFIEASMVSKGIPIVLADTAGFRTEAGPIETLGIENANKVITKADIVLFVVDASKPFDDDVMCLFDLLEEKGKRRIVVVNKWDIPETEHEFITPRLFKEPYLVHTSCIQDTGIDELRNMIADIVFSASSVAHDRIVPNLRQKKALETAVIHLDSAIKALDSGSTVELAAIDLFTAEDSLREVIGDVLRPDILDSIFNNFCVGK